MTSRLRKLISSPGDREVSLQTGIAVTAGFFYGVFEAGIRKKTRASLFSAMLETFETHHSDFAELIHGALSAYGESAYPDKTRVHTMKLQEWKQYLDSWLAKMTGAGSTSQRPISGPDG